MLSDHSDCLIMEVQLINKFSKNMPLIILCLLLLMSTVTAGAEKNKQTFSEENLKTFNLMYLKKIKNTKNAKDKTRLANELLTASDEFQGEIRNIMLSSAYKLVAKSKNSELPILILQKCLKDKRLGFIIKKELLMALIKLEVKKISKDKTALRKKRIESLNDKEFYALCCNAIDNAIALCKICLSECDFKEAKNAARLGILAAKNISSPKTTLFRRYLKIGRILETRYNYAQGRQKKNPKNALLAYIEAGAYKEASQLINDKSSEIIKILVKAGLGKKVSASDKFKAALFWDERMSKQQSSLKEVYMIRAAEFYEQCIGDNNSPQTKLAKIRLLEIHKQLGDMLIALRKPTEWTYLVDLPLKSSKVGYGRLEIITPNNGPIKIAGQKLSTGYKAHANSKLEFYLGGKYKEFSTSFGLLTGAGGKAYFKIVVDGKTVYKSPYMFKNTTFAIKKPVTIKIIGAKKLELFAEANNVSGSHSAWGNPKVR